MKYPAARVTTTRGGWVDALDSGHVRESHFSIGLTGTLEYPGPGYSNIRISGAVLDYLERC